MPFRSTHQRAWAIAGLLLVAVLWGSSFLLVKQALRSIDVYQFLFYRFLLSSMLLGGIFHREIARAPRSTWRAAIALGCLMTGAYVANTEGLRFTTAANSALITGLYLILIPFAAPWTIKTKTHGLAWIGAVTSFVGLYLLTEYSWTGFNRGDALTLLCAAACTAHILCTGTLTHRHRAIPLVVIQFLTVTGCTGLVAVLKDTPFAPITPSTLGIIAFTAIFSTVLAFIIQTMAQRHVDPTRTGIIFGLEGAFGAMIAMWFGGEVLTPTALCGASLMVGGILIAESRPLVRYLRNRLPPRLRGV